MNHSTLPAFGASACSFICNASCASCACEVRSAKACDQEAGEMLRFQNAWRTYYGSMDWFKGKSTGNHGFYYQNLSNIGFSCKFSHHPIL
jgi:hypothetical protein